MEQRTLTAARRELHAVAERLLAGPQHRAGNGIRLRVTGGGFAQVQGPWRVEVTELVGGPHRVPLVGTTAEVAAHAGIPDPGAPDAYGEHADWPPDAPLALDRAAATELVEWFARGDTALRRLAPDREPVLWPEHFDVGTTLDEVNYGVSPGDAGHEAPYAYVGPWTPRTGAFWNAPFGAVAPASGFADVESLAAFFETGREQARR